MPKACILSKAHLCWSTVIRPAKKAVRGTGRNKRDKQDGSSAKTSKTLDSNPTVGATIHTMATEFADSKTCSVSISVPKAYSYYFVHNVFDQESLVLAKMHKSWKRCLAVIDDCIYSLYSDLIKAYFEAHTIAATVKLAPITEDKKRVATLLEVCS